MLIDTHCHLTSNKYKISTDEIIRRAKENGVRKFITIGTSLKENEKAYKVSEKYPEVYSSAGIYPHENLDLTIEELENNLRKQIDSMPKVKGIGECGIDIVKSAPYRQRAVADQTKLFELQIELALKKDLPIILHNRDGDKVVLEILNKYKNRNLKGVAHTFVSSWNFAKKLLDLNFCISFSGIITYKSGKGILETVKNIPINKFLLETDAPYLAPGKHLGKINYPEYVKITAQKVAEVKKLPLEEIENLSTENACKLFDLPKN